MKEFEALEALPLKGNPYCCHPSEGTLDRCHWNLEKTVVAPRRRRTAQKEAHRDWVPC